MRRRGYAIAVGDYEQGLNGVAVPIFDGGGTCVAGLTLCGPEYRLPPRRLRELAGACKNAAAAVSNRLTTLRRSA